MVLLRKLRDKALVAHGRCHFYNCCHGVDVEKGEYVGPCGEKWCAQPRSTRAAFEMPGEIPGPGYVKCVPSPAHPARL